MGCHRTRRSQRKRSAVATARPTSCRSSRRPTGPQNPARSAPCCAREGLYSSLLASWRQQRRDGTLAGQARGRKGKDQRDRKIEELERDNARLARKLDQAETIISVQKKLSRLLGIEQATDEDTES